MSLERPSFLSQRCIAEQEIKPFGSGGHGSGPSGSTDWTDIRRTGQPTPTSNPDHFPVPRTRALWVPEGCLWKLWGKLGERVWPEASCACCFSPSEEEPLNILMGSFVSHLPVQGLCSWKGGMRKRMKLLLVWQLMCNKDAPWKRPVCGNCTLRKPGRIWTALGFSGRGP